MGGVSDPPIQPTEGLQIHAQLIEGLQIHTQLIEGLQIRDWRAASRSRERVGRSGDAPHNK